jgi:hypothetical protein
MANDWTYANNVAAVYNFDNSWADSKNSYDLDVSYGSPVFMTTGAPQGTHWSDWNNTSYRARADDDLDSDFPLASASGASSSFSVVLWFRCDSLSDNNCLVCKYDTGGERSFQIQVNSSAKVQIYHGYNGGASYESDTHGSTLIQYETYGLGYAYDNSTKAYLLRLWRLSTDTHFGTDLDDNWSNNIYRGTAPFQVGARQTSNYHDGKIDELVVFNEAIDADTMDDIWAGTYAPTNPDITFSAGSGSFSLTGVSATLLKDSEVAAGSGSYDETGTTASLLKDSILAAVGGSYDVTGVVAGLLRDSKLTADPESYALTGVDVNLLFGRAISAETDTFALAGTTASLLKDSKTDADPESYVLTGTAATLLYDRLVSAQASAYTLTGSDVTLTYTPSSGYTLSAEAGTFSLTGATASLILDHLLSAGSGSFILTGSDVTLTYTPVNHYSLDAGNGGFSLTGADVTLTYTPATHYTLTTEAGEFNLSGTAATFLIDHILSAGESSFAITGFDADLVYAPPLPVGLVAITITAKKPGITIIAKQPSIAALAKKPNVFATAET